MSMVSAPSRHRTSRHRRPGRAGPSSGCPTRDQRVGGDDTCHLDRRRDTRASGNASSGSRSASSPTVASRTGPSVGDLDAEPVEARLRLGRAGDPGGAPPPLGQVVDRLLDHTFAVPVTGRARIDDRRRSAWRPARSCLDLPGAGLITVAIRSTRHRRAVPPRRRRTSSIPATRCAWSSTRRTTPGTGSNATARRPARTPPRPTASRAARASPTGSRRRRMVDVDVRAALHTHARLAMRPQVPVPDLAGERLVAAIEPERDNLVEQHRRPHVRIIDEPLTHVALDPIERITISRPATHTRPRVRRADSARTVLRS